MCISPSDWSNGLEFYQLTAESSNAANPSKRESAAGPAGMLISPSIRPEIVTRWLRAAHFFCLSTLRNQSIRQHRSRPLQTLPHPPSPHTPFLLSICLSVYFLFSNLSFPSVYTVRICTSICSYALSFLLWSVFCVNICLYFTLFSCPSLYCISATPVPHCHPIIHISLSFCISLSLADNLFFTVSTLLIP